MDAPETRPLIVLEMANNHMGDVSHGVSLNRRALYCGRAVPLAFRFCDKIPIS